MKKRSMNVLYVLCIFFISLHSHVTAVSIRETPTAFRIALNILNQMKELANGLIISEGVVEGSTNLSTLAIDFMIMGHMRNKPGWIGKIGKQEVENNMTEQFEKLYEEFQPLKNILENGMNSTIEVEEIYEMVNVMKDLPVVSRIRSKIEKLHSFIDNATLYTGKLAREYTNKSFSDFISIPFVIEYMLFEPNSSALVQLASAFAASNYESIRWVEAFSTFTKFYDKYQSGQDVQHSRYACFLLLRGLTRLGGWGPLEPYLVSLSEFLDAFSSWHEEKSDKNLERFDEIITLFSTSSRDDNGMSPILESDGDTLSKLVQSLKTVDEKKIESLRHSLSSLAPIAEVSKRMLKLFEIEEVKNAGAFSNGSIMTSRFKSYLGFENDIGMFKRMADSLDPIHEFPSKFSKVPLRSRSIFVQKLAATLHPFFELSNGLLLVDDIYKLSSAIGSFVENLPENMNEQITLLNGLTTETKHIDEASEIVAELIERVRTSSEMIVKNDEIKALFLEESNRSMLKEFIDQFLKMMQFVSFLNGIIGENLTMETHPNWSQSEMIRRFKEIEKSFAKIQNDGKIIQKFVSGLDSMKNFAKKVLKLKSALDNRDMVKEWKKKERKYKIEDFLSLPTIWTNLSDELSSKKDEVQKIGRKFSSFDFLKPLENITYERGLVEATGKLLKLVANSSIIAFNVTENPSKVMSKLLAGTPFGSNILDNLHIGIPPYRSLVEGLTYTRSLTTSIEKLEKFDPDLGKNLRILLEGMESLEIVTDYYHRNPLPYVDTTKLLLSRIFKAEKWVKSIRKKGYRKIKEDVRMLMIGGYTNYKGAAIEVHRFLAQLDRKLINGFRNMSRGLSSFLDAIPRKDKFKKVGLKLKALAQEAPVWIEKESPVEESKECPMPPNKKEPTFWKQMEVNWLRHSIFALLAIISTGIYIYVIHWCCREWRSTDDDTFRPPPPPEGERRMRSDLEPLTRSQLLEKEKKEKEKAEKEQPKGWLSWFRRGEKKGHVDGLAEILLLNNGSDFPSRRVVKISPNLLMLRLPLEFFLNLRSKMILLVESNDTVPGNAHLLLLKVDVKNIWKRLSPFAELSRQDEYLLCQTMKTMRGLKNLGKDNNCQIATPRALALALEGGQFGKYFGLGSSPLVNLSRYDAVTEDQLFLEMCGMKNVEKEKLGRIVNPRALALALEGGQSGTSFGLESLSLIAPEKKFEDKLLEMRECEERKKYHQFVTPRVFPPTLEGDQFGTYFGLGNTISCIQQLIENDRLIHMTNHEDFVNDDKKEGNRMASLVLDKKLKDVEKRKYHQIANPRALASALEGNRIGTYSKLGPSSLTPPEQQEKFEDRVSLEIRELKCEESDKYCQIVTPRVFPPTLEGDQFCTYLGLGNTASCIQQLIENGGLIHMTSREDFVDDGKLEGSSMGFPILDEKLKDVEERKFYQIATPRALAPALEGDRFGTYSKLGSSSLTPPENREKFEDTASLEMSELKCAESEKYCQIVTPRVFPPTLEGDQFGTYFGFGNSPSCIHQPIGNGVCGQVYINSQKVFVDDGKKEGNRMGSLVLDKKLNDVGERKFYQIATPRALAPALEGDRFGKYSELGSSSLTPPEQQKKFEDRVSLDMRELKCEESDKYCQFVKPRVFPPTLEGYQFGTYSVFGNSSPCIQQPIENGVCGRVYNNSLEMFVKDGKLEGRFMCSPVSNKKAIEVICTEKDFMESFAEYWLTEIAAVLKEAEQSRHVLKKIGEMVNQFGADATIEVY